MSSLGESSCALCRSGFTALPALSRALENHAMWCDVGRFGERLAEARAEERARGHKSPRFARCDESGGTASGTRADGDGTVVVGGRDGARVRIVSLGVALDDMEDDETIAAAATAAARGEDGAAALALGACATFDPKAGDAIASFHACSCMTMEVFENEPCGELASRPVVCQQCGALYERAHADVLTARAGVDGEWCVACGSAREPTRVIFSLKEDIEHAYSSEFVAASRARSDQLLANWLLQLELEHEEREAEKERAREAGEAVSEDETIGGNGENATAEEEARSTVDIGGSTTLVFSHETFTHYGVGCDFCGVYPIVGPRYQCEQCANEEFMGFDLCSKCMQNVFEHPNRKRDYRFAQNHTDEHRMVLVRPKPTLIHVMKSLHPELSHAQIMNWIDTQYRVSREADIEAAEAEEADEEPTEAEADGEAAAAALEDDDPSALADDERSS